jgi:hypothetical protein
MIEPPAAAQFPNVGKEVDAEGAAPVWRTVKRGSGGISRGKLALWTLFQQKRLESLLAVDEMVRDLGEPLFSHQPGSGPERGWWTDPNFLQWTGPN